ncbi:MAG: lipid A export permease/ATP-binding protein MsbA [Nitrospirae bacterium]|nr:lipid A export permease/ATP-binding protein MsbA [Nitrospirota bacterium]
MILYRRLLQYVRPYSARFFSAVLCTLAVSGLTAAAAWLVQPVLDDIFIRKEKGMLFLLPFAVLAVYFLKGVFGYAQAYLMRYIGNRVIRDLRQALYGHLVRMPLGFYAKATTGRLISGVINDVGMLQTAVSTVIKDILQQSVTLLALMGVVLYRDWKLALIAFASLPLAIYPLIRLGRKLRGISRRGQEELSVMTAHLQETFTGARVLKAFGMEEREAERFQEKNARYFGNAMKAVRVMETTSPLMEFLGAMGVALIIGYGGYQVIQGTTTPGTFFSFMTAVIMMYGPVRSLSRVSNTLQQAAAAAERVFSLLDQPTERAEDRGAREISEIREGMAVENVVFQYEGAERPALEGISLEARRGEVIALVGASGSGKSTLANLLLRFYEPASGRIAIDGVDIREFRLASLRAMIGVVSQEVILFDDTVRNNIAYGKEDASMEEIERAAAAAYADDFIRKLPQGYETHVGEKGVRLSGGEKQRIAIARALLRNPPLLILDEATSALDSESEFWVQKAIDRLMKGRTTWVIAHRLSTVQNADRIAVMDQGKVVETGRHEELLARNGGYRRLYEMQFLRE